MKLNNLKDLYIHELKDLYSAEKQILKALPKMAKAASNKELKAGFEQHLTETEGQLKILDQVFEKLHREVKLRQLRGDCLLQD